MCSTVTSSTNPIRAKFSLASWPWVPTWDYGKWRRYQALVTRRWRRRRAIICGWKQCAPPPMPLRIQLRSCRHSTFTTFRIKCTLAAMGSVWRHRSIRSMLRHSPKYFGLQKGVSAYTLVANHVLINAKIIGTHEHESHYVFDLLYNNTSDIKPERHSTDTGNISQSPPGLIVLRRTT